jgi:hypothetical protein
MAADPARPGGDGLSLLGCPGAVSLRRCPNSGRALLPDSVVHAATGTAADDAFEGPLTLERTVRCASTAVELAWATAFAPSVKHAAAATARGRSVNDGARSADPAELADVLLRAAQWLIAAPSDAEGRRRVADCGHDAGEGCRDGDGDDDDDRGSTSGGGATMRTRVSEIRLTERGARAWDRVQGFGLARRAVDGMRAAAEDSVRGALDDVVVALADGEDLGLDGQSLDEDTRVAAARAEQHAQCAHELREAGRDAVARIEDGMQHVVLLARDVLHATLKEADAAFDRARRRACRGLQRVVLERHHSSAAATAPGGGGHLRDATDLAPSLRFADDEDPGATDARVAVAAEVAVADYLAHDPLVALDDPRSGITSASVREQYEAAMLALSNLGGVAPTRHSTPAVVSPPPPMPAGLSAEAAWQVAIDMMTHAESMRTAAEVTLKRTCADQELKLHRAVAARTHALAELKRMSDNEVEALQNQLERSMKIVRTLQGEVTDIDDERTSISMELQARQEAAKTAKVLHQQELSRKELAFATTIAAADRLASTVGSLQEREKAMRTMFERAARTEAASSAALITQLETTNGHLMQSLRASEADVARLTEDVAVLMDQFRRASASPRFVPPAAADGDAYVSRSAPKVKPRHCRAARSPAFEAAQTPSHAISPQNRSETPSALDFVLSRTTATTADQTRMAPTTPPVSPRAAHHRAATPNGCTRGVVSACAATVPRCGTADPHVRYASVGAKMAQRSAATRSASRQAAASKAFDRAACVQPIRAHPGRGTAPALATSSRRRRAGTGPASGAAEATTAVPANVFLDPS